MSPPDHTGELQELRAHLMADVRAELVKLATGRQGLTTTQDRLVERVGMAWGFLVQLIRNRDEALAEVVEAALAHDQKRQVLTDLLAEMDPLDVAGVLWDQGVGVHRRDFGPAFRMRTWDTGLYEGLDGGRVVATITLESAEGAGTISGQHLDRLARRREPFALVPVFQDQERPATRPEGFRDCPDCRDGYRDVHSEGRERNMRLYGVDAERVWQGAARCATCGGSGRVREGSLQAAHDDRDEQREEPSLEDEGGEE